MRIKWLMECWLHIVSVILANSLIASSATNHGQSQNVVSAWGAPALASQAAVNSDNYRKFSVNHKNSEDIFSLNLDVNRLNDNGLVPKRSKRASHLIHAGAGAGVGSGSAVGAVVAAAPSSSTTAAAVKRLIDEKQCPEIRNLCSNLHDGSDDLPVLECIQTFLSNQIENLSDECQHAIWSHTASMMNDTMVVQILQKPCQTMFNAMDLKATKGYGVVLGKLLDKKDEIKQPVCVNLINRLEAVAFSDFRFVSSFVRDCENDIEEKSCGRFHLERNILSQGETLACLQTHIDTLSDVCKQGIMHLSELQAENIVKLDRPLFAACGEDVVRLCADARPAQIYKCLLMHKNDAIMSHSCQEQLSRRYKIIAHDYKVSKGLARSCKEDIKINHCRRGVSEDKDVRLAQILLCLEAAHKNNTKISSDCLAEIFDHRKLLMEDYQMSPEILSDCADDINKFCSDMEAGGGKTIHCLMENARPKRKRDRRVTARCQRALEMLMKVTDIGEDWRVDPVLRKACKPVVDIACSDTDGGDARVMACLKDKIGTKYMKPDCELALKQINYFVARNFKLEPQLYRQCKDDAIRICHAKKTWADVNTDQMDPDREPIILPCLYRYAYSTENRGQLKPSCLQELKFTMRRRAISVELIPEVEDACLDDLASYCAEKTGKGEEMQCLQDNMNNLQPECKKAVSEFTENEGGDIELNPIIMTYCRSAMDRYCDKESRENGDTMECLIAHKNEADMRQDLKCRAALEHYQIISLQNYHFSYKFKEACRPYVIRFCPSSNTKNDVVTCLSEVIRNDTLKSQRHSVSKECRQQIRAQLFQQRENIDFDPKLKAACRIEIKEICGDIQHGGGQVLECLQTNSGRLGSDCRHAMFAIKKSELTDSSTDYTLISTCRDMIRQYCHDTEKTKVLDCLKVHKDEMLFDTNCHLIVINRMIEQNTDYRFNPLLQEACKKNIAEYCTKIVATAKQNEELNGKVIDCLKAKFREGKLTPLCEDRMTEVLHEQALNYKLNPLLQTVCKPEIQIICKPNDDTDERGEVEECLKMAFLNGKIISQECKFEVALLIQEAKADIHVDPLLQRACTVDLLKYCSNVKSGNGRQLRCLQTILNDQSKALESDCKSKLEKRMEMFKNAAMLVQQAPEDFGELYSQVVTSPSKKYFLVVLMTFIGFIFIIGLFCGRATRRTIALKNK